MANAVIDDNSTRSLIGASNADGLTPLPVYVDSSTNRLLVQATISGSSGDGALLDGASSSIKASVLDYTNSNPLAVRLTDTNGDYIAAGAGTQYTEGDTDATITGTAMLMEVAGNAVQPVQGTVADGLLVNLGSNNDVTVTGTVTANLSATDNAVLDNIDADLTTIIGHVDGIEALLTTIDADTSNLSVVGGGTEATAIRVTIASDSTGVVSIDDNGGAITVDGTVAVTGVSTVAEQQTQTTHLATIAGDTTSIQTAVELLDNAVYVDDADWTNDTSSHLLVGGLYQSTPQTVTDGDVAPFNITANGALHVAVQNAVTVDLGANNDVTVTSGTIDLGATDNAVLDAIAASVAAIDTDATTIIGHVDGIETLIGTTNTTLGTIDTDTGGILTATQLIDDMIYTAGTDTYAEATSKGGLLLAVRRDADTTLANTTNEMVPLQVDANGYLKVEIFDGGGSHTVDNGGTFVVQENGAALTALQLIDNSIYVDDADWTADTSSHTLVGAVTQVAPTANTDGDTTPLITNALRELRVAVNESDLATAATSHVKKYYTNAGAVTDGIIWSPAAGKRWYVTDLIINVSAAATVTLEDDKAGGDEAVMKFELAANSGISHSFNTPWFSGEDAADLIITTSAGNVYVTVTGYEI